MIDNFCETILSRLKKCLPAERPILLHEPFFDGNEWEYVKECIDTTIVSSVGDFVNKFEKMLVDFTGNKFAIATVNGTSALHIALMLAGVQKGDEVLVPALTFVATANAVVDIKLLQRPPVEVWEIIFNDVLDASTGHHRQHFFDPPLVLVAKADVRIQATSSVNNVEVDGGFDIILAPE